jgi:hypothetical protein
VCRDLEFRVNNKSIKGHRGTVEMCIDGEWHEVNCVTTSTTKSIQEPNNDGLIIGLGSGLGISFLLLLVSVVSALVGLVVSKISCLKRDSTMQGKIKG